MPRGGRRLGAGAPKGNWNGLKTGRHSPRFRQALLALRHDPPFMEVYRLLMRAERAASSPTSRRELHSQLGRIERLLGQLLRRTLVAQVTKNDPLIGQDSLPTGVNVLPDIARPSPDESAAQTGVASVSDARALR